MKFYLMSLFILLVGCSSQQHSKDKSKPYVQTITCAETAKACHETALRACPNGYRVTNRVKGEKSGDETIYRVSVLCRANPYKTAY